jgi:STAS domain-containing protein
MMYVTSNSAGEELIQVDGTFDAVAAWDVRRRLRELPPSAHVVLDFTRVKEFLDLGVAVVAPGLLERGGPGVSVRGLRQHQHRMFRYFGVDVGAAVSAAAVAAAAVAEADARD